LPLLVTPTADAAPKAAPKALPATEPAKPGLVHPGNLFTYPAWHKGADRRWNWGLWEEASSLWLKGLRSEEPQTPMLLIADQLTQVQVNRQYAAWSPLMPVVALPKSGVTKKRWLLLAVPAPKDMARAQQLLRSAQGQEATAGSWAQWQTSLGLGQGTGGAAAPTAQNTAPAPVAPTVLPMVSSSAPRTAEPPAAVLVSPPAAARARDLPVAKAQGESPEARLAPSTQEAPQLSRTDAERLPASGPVPPTAKAIDADYQLIEKSLARGDHQAALDGAIRLEKYIGENWRTQYLAGVALMGLSRWEPAIAALGKAQALNPRHATAALYLSVALQERGEHARAIQVLDKAQQLQPLSPELWLNQGHSHQALGHKVEARKAYNRFLELSVNRQDLAVQRVWVQNRLEKDKG
jgi:Flp pilus assembly protein TadD